MEYKDVCFLDDYLRNLLYRLLSFGFDDSLDKFSMMAYSLFHPDVNFVDESGKMNDVYRVLKKYKYFLFRVILSDVYVAAFSNKIDADDEFKWFLDSEINTLEIDVARDNLNFALLLSCFNYIYSNNINISNCSENVLKRARKVNPLFR